MIDRAIDELCINHDMQLSAMKGATAIWKCKPESAALGADFCADLQESEGCCMKRA